MSTLSSTRIRWFGLPGRSSTPSVPYAITCPCGQLHQGRRRRSPRFLTCRCGEQLFVLPLSPLPPDLFGEPLQPSKRDRPSWYSRRLIAFVSGFLFLILAGLTLFWTVNRWDRPLPPVDAVDWQQHQLNGMQWLRSGAPALAAEQFHIAATSAHTATPSERRRLRHWQRQAALVADLLSDSLVEIVRHASVTHDREWPHLFRQRYQHRAVAFDAQVMRHPNGTYRVRYGLFLGLNPIRLELGQPTAFQHVPFVPGLPKRLLFAARLADVRHEPNRGWLVEFDPNSCELLTEPALLTASSLAGDEAVSELVRTQAAWTETP